MAKTLLERFVLRRSAIYTTPGTPFDTLKRVYGDLTDGEGGTVPTVEIQRWNGVDQVFQIADHAIDATAPTVYDDDIAIGSGFTFSASSNFEAQGAVAILTFTVDKTGHRISVKGKGKLNSSGVLIENLAEIVYDVLVLTHGIGWEWDAVSYGQAFAVCAALGLRGGGVILDDDDPVNLADGILKPCGGAWVGGDGRLTLFVESLAGLVQPEEFYDPHEVEVTLRRSLDAIVNDIQLQHRFNWRKRAFASLEAHYDGFASDSDAQSILEYKRRTQPLEAPWLRTATAADAAIDALLALRKRPRWDVHLAVGNFKAQLQQQGDVVAFTGHNRLPGGAELGETWDRRLMRVRQVDLGFSRGGCTLQGYDLEKNWWIVAYLADGTYQANGAIRAGGGVGVR